MSEDVQSKGFAALVRILQKLNHIPSDVQYNAAEARGKSPILYFESLGLLKEREATLAIAEALGFSFQEIDRSNEPTIAGLLSNPLLSKIEINHWRAIRALPLQLDDNKLSILFSNPLDHEAKRDFEFRLGVQIVVVAGLDSQVQAFLGRLAKSNVDASINSLLDADELTFPDSLAENNLESQLKHEDVSAPLVIRLVDKIFSDAMEKRASDIHLSPEKDKLEVKIRIDGIMYPLMDVPQHLKNPAIARIKLLCGMDISEKRKPQDGRLRLKSQRGNIDLRISTVPSVHGENIVIRILSNGTTQVSLEQLGLSEAQHEQLRRVLKGSAQVVLVSGPTGSGKTSTLYAGLRYLADGKRNIITIEDPIEYRLEGITQIQVNAKIGMNFAEGLRSILRQDPDVIMVGEIRDLETANIAMQAAQTGHLVLSTIHTNSAPASVVRLLDIGVAPHSIAPSVSTILAQRLARTLCPHCAKPASEETKALLKKYGIDGSSARAAQGCESCGGTGYKGRIGIFSILEITDAIRDAIREHASESEIVKRARAHGYRSLWEGALDHVAHGTTSYDEVERVLGPMTNDEEAALIVQPGAQKVSSGLEKPTLLLVEDDESTRSILAMLFRDQMFDVIEAENGVDGLEKVYQHLPTVIVSDLMMPRMSGLEMVQKLKRDTRTRNIPILMLTAASTEENEIKLLEQGVDDFVGKTVDSKIMIARVNKLLSRAVQ